jgi:hypothetical protein
VNLFERAFLNRNTTPMLMMLGGVIIGETTSWPWAVGAIIGGTAISIGIDKVVDNEYDVRMVRAVRQRISRHRKASDPR